MSEHVECARDYFGEHEDRRPALEKVKVNGQTVTCTYKGPMGLGGV